MSLSANANMQDTNDASNDSWAAETEPACVVNPFDPQYRTFSRHNYPDSSPLANNDQDGLLTPTSTATADESPPVQSSQEVDSSAAAVMSALFAIFPDILPSYVANLVADRAAMQETHEQRVRVVAEIILGLDEYPKISDEESPHMNLANRPEASTAEMSRKRGRADDGHDLPSSRKFRANRPHRGTKSNPISLDSDGASETNLIVRHPIEASPSPTLNGPTDSPHPTVECACCFDDVELFETICCDADSAHAFCTGCVVRHVETLIGASKFEVKCMDSSGCSTSFATAELRRILNPKTYAFLEKLRRNEDLRLAQIEDLAECPFCDYKAIYPPIEEDPSRAFKCENPDCLRESCRRCTKDAHGIGSCNETTQEKAQHKLEEAMTEALLRSCSNCKQPYLKDDGCNKIRCATCGKIQCYVCRTEITAEGYNHFGATKCPLYDNTDERHEGEVAKAKTEMLSKLATEDPELQDVAIKFSKKVEDDTARKIKQGQERFLGRNLPDFGPPQRLQFIAPAPDAPRFEGYEAAGLRMDGMLRPRLEHHPLPRHPFPRPLLPPHLMIRRQAIGELQAQPDHHPLGLRPAPTQAQPQPDHILQRPVPPRGFHDLLEFPEYGVPAFPPFEGMNDPSLTPQRHLDANSIAPPPATERQQFIEHRGQLERHRAQLAEHRAQLEGHRAQLEGRRRLFEERRRAFNGQGTPLQRMSHRVRAGMLMPPRRMGDMVTADVDVDTDAKDNAHRQEMRAQQARRNPTPEDPREVRLLADTGRPANKALFRNMDLGDQNERERAVLGYTSRGIGGEATPRELGQAQLQAQIARLEAERDLMRQQHALQTQDATMHAPAQRDNQRTPNTVRDLVPQLLYMPPSAPAGPQLDGPVDVFGPEPRWMPVQLNPELQQAPNMAADARARRPIRSLFGPDWEVQALARRPPMPAADLDHPLYWE